VKKIKLEEHRFYIKLISDITHFHKAEKGSEKAKYCKEVGSVFHNLKKTMEDLTLIRTLLAGLHSINNPVDYHQYPVQVHLQYHIENYFLRIMTYKDLSLQLIAVVCQLKVKQKHNLESKVRDLLALSSLHSIIPLIDNIKILLSSVREIRNQLTHEGSFSDIDLTLLKILQGLRSMAEKHNFIRDRIRDLPEINTLLDMTITKNIKDMAKAEEDIATNFLANLDVLYTQYEKNIPEQHPLS